MVEEQLVEVVGGIMMMMMAMMTAAGDLLRAVHGAGTLLQPATIIMMTVMMTPLPCLDSCAPAWVMRQHGAMQTMTMPVPGREEVPVLVVLVDLGLLADPHQSAAAPFVEAPVQL